MLLTPMMLIAEEEVAVLVHLLPQVEEVLVQPTQQIAVDRLFKGVIGVMVIMILT